MFAKSGEISSSALARLTTIVHLDCIEIQKNN
jgi:hypothetical protein